MKSGQYHTRRGYALVEILVVLAVIGVLVSMSVPSLIRVRATARRAQCAAQMAQHVRVLNAYAADNRDFWPYPLPADRGRDRAVSFQPHSSGSITIEPASRYETLTGLWHLPVLSAYADRLHHETLVCPSDIDQRQAWKSTPPGASTIEYRLSLALLISPEALSADHARIDDPRLWVGQKVSDVTMPSQKAALRELSMHEPGREGRAKLGAPPYNVNVAACDASVAYRSTASAVRGLSTLEESVRFPESLDTITHGVTFSRTPKGVHGRDW